MAEITGKTHFVEGIVAASALSDMVPTSAAADSALERRILRYLMSVNAHTIRLGISFDRPAITGKEDCRRG